jgi:FecR protein
MSRLIVSVKALLTVVCILLAVPSFAASHVRIVRLKDVQGDVQIDRNAGQGYEKAFPNLPITQGAKIKTKADGLVAVEFEDGTALRITPATVVEFQQLSLRDSGAKVSSVLVEEGTAYINYVGAKDDEFTVTFGHEKVALAHPAHLRVSMGDTNAAVAVLKGDAEITGPSGSVQVAKNQTAFFDLADKDRYKLAKNVDPGSYDIWDKQQDQYQQTYAANNSQTGYSPYSYGMSDLNYYGSFTNYPGYGTLWQPYFVGAGWDPFMSGAWAYYPGSGYSWVSGYPWGWTPYHTGSWAFVPGYGWGWQPGGSWTGLNTTPRYSNAPANFQAPQVPSQTAQRTVLVSRGPEPVQLGKSSSHLQIVNNSAGLGIPPGSIKNLSALSNTVQRTGFTTTKLHLAPIGVQGWNSGFSPMSAPMRSMAGTGSTSGHASSGHVGGSAGGGHAH